MTKKADTDEAVLVGSGNVFADMGLPNPEERLLKAQLMYAIGQTIKQQKLTQAQAAEKVHLAQPDLSRILNGRASNYSIERLMRVLLLLGHNISIGLSPARTPIGRLGFRFVRFGTAPKPRARRKRTSPAANTR